MEMRSKWYLYREWRVFGGGREGKKEGRDGEMRGKKGDGALLQRRPETPAAFAGPHGTGINVWMRPYLMSSMKAT